MNLADLQIKSILSTEERLALKEALLQDEVIVQYLTKIIDMRISKCKPSLKLTGDVAYPYKRAALDGAQYELEWLLKLLTVDKE